MGDHRTYIRTYVHTYIDRRRCKIKCKQHSNSQIDGITMCVLGGVVCPPKSVHKIFPRLTRIESAPGHRRWPCYKYKAQKNSKQFLKTQLTIRFNKCSLYL